MDENTAKDLLAMDMGHFSVSVGILRSLVDRNVIHPSEAALIIRDAIDNLPEIDELGWKSVVRGTYEKVAQKLEMRAMEMEQAA